MTSPIHTFLFSPPPSPPLPVGVTEAENKGGILSPLRSLLPAAVRRSFDAARSPRSPKVVSSFMLPPTSTPSRPSSPAGRAAMRNLKHIDVEAANLPTFSRQRTTRLTPIISPRLLFRGTTVPKPILRLVVFIALVLSGVMLMQTVVDALLPAPVIAPYDMTGHYMPPQAAAIQLSRPIVAAPPRTERPHNHPLPKSHELLALQSFVAESRYHFLRSDVDVSKPLDVSDLIGVAARRLGETGSARYQQWLDEVAGANARNVVLWYATSSVPHYATEGVMARHGYGHRPTMISTADRSDGELVLGIFARLGFDLNVAPVLVIGGEPVHATEAVMDELRSSGELATKLANIGWRV